MKHVYLSLFICLYAYAAQASFLKIGGQIGTGQFQASRDSLTASEGPYAFTVSLDYDISSRWSLGAEHLRSLKASPVGTSVAMTGFTGRWYFLGPVPNALDFSKSYLRARVLQKGFFPYAGWSIGFIQASILAADNKDSVIALLLGASAKVGFDYPFYGNFAFRSELNVGVPAMGTGTVNFFTATVGGIYFW